jgi:2'-5' RNA ligase superfamily
MVDAELHSALLVAVPEAADAVDDWRESTSYAKPSSGVPPRLTILSPFTPPASIDNSLIDDLRTLFGAFESFTFELAATGRFPGVLYLAPDPVEPFVRLTGAVVDAYPDYPPYGDAFASIVPHLTTAEGDDETLSKAEADVRLSLPIAASATEVLLIEEIEPDSACWQARARLSLRTL